MGQFYNVAAPFIITTMRSSARSFLARLAGAVCLAALILVMPLSGAASPQTQAYRVIVHPDGRLYVGDLVSFEVLLPEGATAPDEGVEVIFDGRVLARAGFAPHGVAGRMQATFWWVWDTRLLTPGLYTLTFRLAGEEWEQIIHLHPANQAPPPEPFAHWEYATTACCTIYYITGTAAERDLSALMTLVDEQAAQVDAALQAEFEQSVTVVFLPRTLGQGGFATDDIYVSYLDRNYAGASTEQVIQHELVHVLDLRRGDWLRPALLIEGLAVYLSGGHYKEEALARRAATLLDLGWYIPLPRLAEDFYHQQHEIGYLEAGALVQYLIETYGWQAFDDFYRDVPISQAGGQTAALEAALGEHFGLDWTGLEQNFLVWLDAQEVSEAARTDLRLTVELYDAIRRYQRLFDPSAYFLTAWLPDGAAMRERGIVADYLRRPSGWQNEVIESLLVDADRSLRAGDFLRAQRRIELVNWLLDLLD